MITGIYRYGGLTIRSPWKLPGLNDTVSRSVDPQAETPFLTIRRADRGVWKWKQPIFNWSGRFGLQLHRAGNDWVFSIAAGAEFWIRRDGGEVACDPGDAGWSETVAEAFVRRVLPRLVQLRGCLVLHAAALRSPSGTVLLCGRSGAGKSTLAASLHRSLGWSILGDDTAILQTVDGRTLVLPGTNGVTLWEDSQAAVGGSFAESKRIEAYATKFRNQEVTGFAETGLPLHTIYHLGDAAASDSAAVTIERIAPSAGAGLLSAQSIRFNPADRGAEAQRFLGWMGLARQKRQWALLYPRRFDMLARVAERLNAENQKRLVEAPQ